MTMKEKNSNRKQKLMELFDIAKYADRIEDEKIFRNAESVIYEQFYRYLNSLSHDDESLNQGVRFTDEQFDLIKSVTRQICKPERNFFSSSILLISIWYPPTLYIPYHLETWRQIWYVLTNVIDSGKDDWFMTYWSFADQYYRFQLDCGSHNALRDYDEMFGVQQKKFKEFHLAVQSYILYKEKYELLSKILNFSHVYPKDYILTDNTFNDIIDDVIKFNNKGFGYLSSNYMMSGLTNDVNSDERIFGIIVRFFTVLLYRLHYLDNSSPLTHYDVSVINRNDINSLNCAIECILILEYWISEKTVKKATEILGFNYDGSNEKIQNLLNNFKKDLLAKRDNKLTHPITAPEKIRVIKEQLIEKAVEAIEYFSIPRQSDSCLNVEKDEKIFPCSANVELQIGDIAQNIPKLSVNVEDALIHALSVQEQNCYCQFFLFNKPNISFMIRFEDIPKALENLCLDDKSVIISLGVQLSSFIRTLGVNPNFRKDESSKMIYNNKVEIIELPSSMASIVVIKRSNLPYMMHVPCDKEKMELIENKSMLYSNIDKIGDDNRNLVVRWYSKLTMRKDFTRYVMLNVKYLSDSSVLDIEKIKAFDTLIPE